ncbi:hypothetical protein L3X38_021268 [Prunus dulcis]|uniref:Uncharacterized protein n=1 Tax=Prunus dulcis TaxID=3755 RepID=A0AAD4VWH3_PRUDU|nr:hypothetical protein L3X38_021268 [Prunus dulcis]
MSTAKAKKALKDGLKKNEETISSVAAEVRSVIAELKSKVEKDSSKECENGLKTETAKFQALYEKFCKDQANHLQALKGIISNYEEEKEWLCTRYEQLKEANDRTFSFLRKTLGSFLESDEDIPADD